MSNYYCVVLMQNMLDKCFILGVSPSNTKLFAIFLDVSIIYLHPRSKLYPLQFYVLFVCTFLIKEYNLFDLILHNVSSTRAHSAVVFVCFIAQILSAHNIKIFSKKGYS